MQPVVARRKMVQLRGLLLQRHSRDQVRDARLEGLRGIEVSGCGILGLENQGCTQEENHGGCGNP